MHIHNGGQSAIKSKEIDEYLEQKKIVNNICLKEKQKMTKKERVRTERQSIAKTQDQSKSRTQICRYKTSSEIQHHKIYRIGKERLKLHHCEGTEKLNCKCLLRLSEVGVHNLRY